MPISGTITPVGVTPTPTPSAAREVAAQARAAAAAETREPVKPASAGVAPAVGAATDAAAGAAAAPDGTQPKPGDEKYEAWRVEAIQRQTREAAQARLAVKQEREALAREREAFEARENGIVEREKRVNDVEKRLSSYRYNPHLALQDLSSFGVTFEMLAQAVAQGMATPDQIAAAEAAEARREMQEFRREQAEREQRQAEEREEAARARMTARQRAERDARERDAQARADLEEQASAEWHGELKAVIARDAAAYPLLATRLDRGGFQAALDFAEGFTQKEGRVPTNDEVLQAVEGQLEKEAEEAAAALANRPRRTAPAGTLSNGLRPAPATTAPAGQISDDERRARALAAIDRAFGRGR